MAATQTVPQYHQDRNFTPIVPKRGVITLFGYGIKACVDRGHLILEDGIGPERRRARFARIGHGLRRLVVIGSDGMVTLGALRWLADQDASFVMLNRDGSVLAVTGPVRPSDARLRRAQVLAHQSGIALEIVRELIGKKLEAQEQLARDGLNNCETAQAIARAREAITTTETIELVRLLESRAAHSYWSAWRKVPVNFPKREFHRVPEYWRTFGTRVSPLTGSPRLAANPVNAMFNYLYAVLESEARLAIAALGLDPGLGVLHADTPARDSLACDVMEPIRPDVDAYVLKWISHETLRREWFFEQRDGSCRLMGSFAVWLSETAPTWGRAVAPVAEWVSHALWSTIPTYRRKDRPATRLTQTTRREAKGITSGLPPKLPPRPQSFCKNCGATIGRGRTYCANCSNALNTAGLIKAAQHGRVASHSDEAEGRRAETQRRHAAAKAGWLISELPPWLTKDIYLREIQPRLKTITLSALASALRISLAYAVDIRSSRRVPHPRHWQTLAQIVGISVPLSVARMK
jgi:CRISPR-associated endonuclease Cas1